MHPRSRRDGGQILVIFVLALVAMFAMAALLFDGGNALVHKRQLQDAGDAAALAAANVIQSGTVRGCSTTAGGAPRSEVVSAARAAVTAALGSGFDTSKIVVTCPSVDWAGNYAVQVDIADHSPGYFGSVVGFSGFAVGTTSQAVNGQVSVLKYSVVELDPWNATWPNGLQGCPSILLSGGPTIILDGSVQINSRCPAGYGGALGTNGNAASLTFNNSAFIRMVGGYAPGPLTITPAPVTGASPVLDPLAGLPAVDVSALPVQKDNVLNLGGANTTVLKPGVYKGGIAMGSKAVALLQPGLYVMQGGGFTIGAQNKVYSVAAGVTSTADSTWDTTDCLATNCGVLIFNTGTTSTMGQLSVGAGATLKLRPYLPTADPNASGLSDASAYLNLLFWQDASPVPSPSYEQPIVQLNGGGTVNIAGAVYAPSAAVRMGGGSGGAGGMPTDLTLQFISWDLTLQGNSNFHFFYQSNAFPKPTDYGLIK